MKHCKIKSLFSLALFVLFTNLGMTQTPLSIYFSASSEILVNEKPLTKKTKVKDLVKLLGEPTRKIIYPSGETSYFYEQLGVVFFTMKGHIKGLGVNYNWDGDEKFTETSFRGNLHIGELKIHEEILNKSINRIENIAFVCPIPSLCASRDRDSEVHCIVGFKDGKLTQVAFMMR
jgi:hypothetical protein